MYQLRDYQDRAVNETLEALAAGESICLSAPTGSGKTVIGCEVVRRFAVSTLWIAHRRELIQQAATRLRAFTVPCGVILAGQPRASALAVQVGSVQTLNRRSLPPARLLVIDECHHTPSPTFKRLLEAYPGVARLGLTATAFRMDGRGLGSIFNRIIVAAHTDELCANGTLIEPRVYAPPSASVEGVRIKRGDYDVTQLADVCDRPKLVGDIVEQWQRRAAGKRTVVFAVNVPHSRHIQASFTTAGVKCEHIDGQTPLHQRAAILERIASGATTVLTNCMVLSEGWDLPALECACIARPTASLCLHMQMIGRIMRACPDKTGAIVLDHAGNFCKHGRVTQRLQYSLDDGAVVTPHSNGTGLRTCPVCFRMVLASRTHCPECGTAIKTAPIVPEHAAGELEAWDAGADTEAQERTFHELIAEAGDRGVKPGWAFYRFKERYGVFPPVLKRDDGSYVFLSANAPDDVRRAALDHWIAEGMERGFKGNYGACRFKAAFGCWPRFKRVSA